MATILSRHVPGHPPEYADFLGHLKAGHLIRVPAIGSDWGWSIQAEEQADGLLAYVLRQDKVYVKEFSHVYEAVNWLFACCPDCDVMIECGK